MAPTLVVQLAEVGDLQHRHPHDVQLGPPPPSFGGAGDSANNDTVMRAAGGTSGHARDELQRQRLARAGHRHVVGVIGARSAEPFHAARDRRAWPCSPWPRESAADRHRCRRRSRRPGPRPRRPSPANSASCLLPARSIAPLARNRYSSPVASAVLKVTAAPLAGNRQRFQAAGPRDLRTWGCRRHANRGCRPVPTGDGAPASGRRRIGMSDPALAAAACRARPPSAWRRLRAAAGDLVDWPTTWRNRRPIQPAPSASPDPHRARREKADREPVHCRSRARN